MASTAYAASPSSSAACPRVPVRVVATNALREARNRSDFIRRAEEVLGHPVEVISGREEARLIYLGVANSMPDSGGRRLVSDIGGGSTEFIIGQGFESELRKACRWVASATPNATSATARSPRPATPRRTPPHAWN